MYYNTPLLPDKQDPPIQVVALWAVTSRQSYPKYTFA